MMKYRYNNFQDGDSLGPKFKSDRLVTNPLNCNSSEYSRNFQLVVCRVTRRQMLLPEF